MALDINDVFLSLQKPAAFVVAGLFICATRQVFQIFTRAISSNSQSGCLAHSRLRLRNSHRPPMLIGIDDIHAYERMQLSIALQAIQNSPQFNVTQKTCVERLFQDIVNVLTREK